MRLTACTTRVILPCWQRMKVWWPLWQHATLPGWWVDSCSPAADPQHLIVVFTMASRRKSREAHEHCHVNRFPIHCAGDVAGDHEPFSESVYGRGGVDATPLPSPSEPRVACHHEMSIISAKPCRLGSLGLSLSNPKCERPKPKRMHPYPGRESCRSARAGRVLSLAADACGST